MRCSECSYRNYVILNGSPGRYYCRHPKAAKSVNAARRMIGRCKRGTSELKIKTSPKWCPLKGAKN